jgi:hypothetical protein
MFAKRTPDFLLTFLALTNFMRLSLTKAEHAGVGGVPWQEMRIPGPKTVFSNAFTPCTRALARANCRLLAE